MKLAKSLMRIRVRLLSVVKAIYRIASGEASLSYSQYGEDLMLAGFLGDKFYCCEYRGFWVDIGAHHPARFSNTKIFSDRGWRGINVDAQPEAIKTFERVRKRDINVNIGVGDQEGDLDYYQYADYALNTFSGKTVEERAAGSVHAIGKLKVPVVTLRALLDEHLPKGQHIDFFTIDTEGLDISILRSNDWVKYRPDYILIEIHRNGRNIGIVGGEVWTYLKNHGYEFVAQGFCTTIFKRVEV